MTSYVRPPIDLPVFRDADGRVIDYGNQWEDAEPPDDSYSVETHPERFAPLHTVADALISHLRDTYDVELTEVDHVEAADGSEGMAGMASGLSAVRVKPNDPGCAALTFVYTDHPGIVLRAGLLHDFPFPICGCDACDETAESQAEELEQKVFAVVAGRYRESVGPGAHGQVGFAMTYPGGSVSGMGNADEFPAERLAAARPVLRALTGRWGAWPVTEPGLSAQSNTA